MWIQREIEALVSSTARERPVMVVSGCRQAGKTSLLEALFPTYRYVSLDAPALAEEAEQAGGQFLERLGTPLIIDEVQYAPSLLRHIKQAVDRRRDVMGQFLLTGSQKFTLMQGVTESLAGRVGLIDCHSLSAFELERWHHRKTEGEELLRAIFLGGYPELHGRGLSPERFFGDYVATYLERDVRHVLQVRNLRDFDRFMRLLAVRNGQLVSSSAIASELGVASNTIKSWLSVLVASNIIFMLEPYYQNLGKRLVKTPKLYFLDTGLACYLAGLRSSADLQQSALLGSFFEAHALGQMVRWFANCGHRAPLYFYRDHQGHEVDFIIPVGEKLKLLECKWSEVAPRRIQGFDEIEKLIGAEKILKRILITSSRGSYVTESGLIRTDTVDMSDALVA